MKYYNFTLKKNLKFNFFPKKSMVSRPLNINHFNLYRYILTMVDYFSKWVHAYKLRTKCSKEICKKITKYIYQYGPPKKLLSDHG